MQIPLPPPMPNVRREIFNLVADDLRLKASAADRAVDDNRYKLKRLVEEQQGAETKAWGATSASRGIY